MVNPAISKKVFPLQDGPRFPCGSPAGTETCSSFFKTAPHGPGASHGDAVLHQRAGPDSSPGPTNAPPAAATPPAKFRDFNEVVRGTERFDGLMTLYRTNETLYAELRPPQFDQPFIAPIAIARGLAMAGQPLNFGDEWILVFQRSGDKVQLIRQNIHFKAPENTPLQKAVKQNYTDSILMALPIVTINPGGGRAGRFRQIFLTDFAQLGFGHSTAIAPPGTRSKPSPTTSNCRWRRPSAALVLRMFCSGDDGVVDSPGHHPGDPLQPG